MKKIILSLSALFTIGVASAQSYIKQPDPTTYNVVEYKATKKAEPAAEVKAEAPVTAPAAATTPAAKTKVATTAPRQERARVEDFTQDAASTTSQPAVTDKKVASKNK
ncbi:hypothetical protein [Flavobacterium subsaxonicum]|uniref:Uncharacterized protein n=1 Tax=Flavobacterium subsaxonicum WB 4.1-42 = DSM 21790 TaxID=1121898 RepID=A0A0A2MPS1_9FLAO|nr:hypothetical protein [Flavobacterium subsaxonicum]KGO94324.1 hypothetical protein Q766_05235 [Flavobacterium subsaxonicum WB 4.1-42 = DSM 21790]